MREQLTNSANEKASQETEVARIDVTEDFSFMSGTDFMQRLNELRKEPSLYIELDLTEMGAEEFTERIDGYSRRLKAFLEGNLSQERKATVNITQGQYDEIMDLSKKHSDTLNASASAVKFQVTS